MLTKRAMKNLARKHFPDELVRRQRMALVSLSLVLITYAIAGGTINSEATLLNLPMSFKRPMVLLGAAWIIWVYFLYRYLLVTDSPWSEFVNELKLHALADERVRRLCLPALSRFELSSEWRATAHRQVSDGWTLSIVKRDGRYYFDPGQFFRPATQAIPSNGPGQVGYFELTPAEARTYRFAVVCALLKAIVFETTFSELILPNLLIWLTPVIWILAYGAAGYDLVKSGHG